MIMLHVCEQVVKFDYDRNDVWEVGGTTRELCSVLEFLQSKTLMSETSERE